MAYFSNSSESATFDGQCSKCRFGKNDCPVKGVQLLYNYEAANNQTASEILEAVVSNAKGCELFVKFKAVLSTPIKSDLHKF